MMMYDGKNCGNVFFNRLLVKSGPCKKTTTSASILRVDLLTANLVTNSWLEAMKYTVQIKVLRHLAPMPLQTFIGMLHMRQCKNTSDNKCCYQTNQTWWPLQIENAVQKKVFSPQVTHLTHRHRLIAKKRKKKRLHMRILSRRPFKQGELSLSIKWH